MIKIEDAVIGAIIGVGGTIVGAVVTYFTSVRLRDADKWKLFQEELAVIKSRIIAIERESGIEAVEAIHRASLEVLASAVYRVRPYVFWGSNRCRLTSLWEKYRTANRSKDSGFVPADLSGGYKDRPADLFPDPPRAAKYLVEALDEMTNL